MKKAKTKMQTSLTPGDLQAIGDIVGGLMDKQAGFLASKNDIEGVKVNIEGIRADIEGVKVEMATKDDLKNLERDLKAYMHQGFEFVMQGMDSLSDRFVEKKNLTSF